MDNTEIVVGVDGSSHADIAVRWAATRAQHTGAQLRLLYAQPVPVIAPAMPLAAATVAAAAPDEQLADAGDAVLAAAAGVAHAQTPGVDVVTEVRVGGAAQVLIDASTDVALVVVGSRGLGGFSGLLLGSVGVQVSGHALCPTVVVRAPGPTTGPVVVGVDDSESARTALAFAFAEAYRLNTSVIAVHAWTMTLPTGPAEAAALATTDDDRTRHQQSAQQILTDALADCRQKYPDITIIERLTEAGPAGALLEAADEPAMIVVGTRGHGGFVGLLLGSTSQAVLHHATCPVAVTRPSTST